MIPYKGGDGGNLMTISVVDDWANRSVTTGGTSGAKKDDRGRLT